ncbi:MAG: hypothetical protein AAFX56_00590 [Pseudomonadota bacterium]
MNDFYGRQTPEFGQPRWHILAVMLMLALSGCTSVGDALISVIPTRDMGPYKIDPVYDQAAKALRPEPGKGLLYVILDTRRDDCGYLDVWLGDDGMGRVFEQEYLYIPAEPGPAILKMQGTRVDWRARKQFFVTTTAPIAIHADQTSFIVIEPTRDRRCVYKNVSLTELSEASGRALLEQRLLSKLNDHGFFERGMKLTNDATVLKRIDSCGGREIAAEPFGDGPNPYYCLYEEKEVLRED